MEKNNNHINESDCMDKDDFIKKYANKKPKDLGVKYWLEVQHLMYLDLQKVINHDKKYPF